MYTYHTHRDRHTYIYIHIYRETHSHIHIYIYRERHRERERDSATHTHTHTHTHAKTNPFSSNNLSPSQLSYNHVLKSATPFFAHALWFVTSPPVSPHLACNHSFFFLSLSSDNPDFILSLRLSLFLFLSPSPSLFLYTSPSAYLYLSLPLSPSIYITLSSSTFFPLFYSYIFSFPPVLFLFIS